MGVVPLFLMTDTIKNTKFILFQNLQTVKFQSNINALGMSSACVLCTCVCAHEYKYWCRAKKNIYWTHTKYGGWYYFHRRVSIILSTGGGGVCSEGRMSARGCLRSHHIWTQGCEPRTSTWAWAQAGIWVSPAPLIVSTSEAVLLQEEYLV